MIQNNNNLARRLRDYIRDRAKVEGVKFDLELSFFEHSIGMNANPIFGVTHDGKKMLEDDQEPESGWFQKWILEHSGE